MSQGPNVTRAMVRQTKPVAVSYEPSAIPPPHDLETERIVLAEILCDTDGKAMPLVADLLKPEHFYSEAHRRVYEACEALYAAQQPTDLTAVGAHLRSTGRLQQVGGHEYLSELERAWTVGTKVRAMAEVVFDRWRLRCVLELMDRTRAEILYGQATTDVQPFLESSTKALAEVVRRSPRSTGRPLLDVLKTVVREVSTTFREASMGEKHHGFSTSFPTIDEITGGLLPGRKLTVVGLPGKGKSVVGLQVAREAAARGVGVAFFATEQTAEELGVRLMSAVSRVDSRRIGKARHVPTGVTSEEWSTVCERLTPEVATLPLVIESSPTLTVDDIATRVRTLADTMPVTHKVPLGLVVVDYVQRLATPKGMENQQRNHAIDYATTELKTLAQSLGIAVLELAQQSTKSDKSGKPAKPELGMVYYSRKVEQESDVVLYLWERGPDDHVVVIAKSRDGETGEVEVDFEKPFSTMRERGSGPSYDGGYYESR